MENRPKEEKIEAKAELSQLDHLRAKLAKREAELAEWQETFDSRVDDFRKKEYYRPSNLYSVIIKVNMVPKNSEKFA